VTLPRIVAAEALDHLPAADPAARRARRDLVRVHHAMGTRALVVRGWQALVSPQRAAAPLQILELGAGDGTLLLGVARALAPAWPRVQLTLLDRLDIVDPATLAGYAAMGWAARPETADVLDWAASAAAAPPWDLITTALFLHHFEGRQLAALLAAVACRSQRFFACEPRRGWLGLAGSHCVGAIGASRVTRRDAVLSVHAGFRGHELGALWPGRGAGWQAREYAAGPFSHCFGARRNGAA
jgi:hypothetical protein